jgi:phospholipid N-methyltransferase
MAAKLKENLVFLRETITQFQNTGAICSTSRWAAEAMTNPMRGRKTQPLNILELGPGTGSVTIKILADMLPGDQLTICEINPRFMKALKERLVENPDFQRHKDRIRFYECPAQELPEDQKYDFVVCSLPFLNFDVQTVREIFTKLKQVSMESTLMTYYQYMGLRHLSKVVAAPDRKRRMNDLDDFFGSITDKKITRRDRVWLNLLPINIYTLGSLGSLPIF